MPLVTPLILTRTGRTSISGVIENVETNGQNKKNGATILHGNSQILDLQTEIKKYFLRRFGVKMEIKHMEIYSAEKIESRN